VAKMAGVPNEVIVRASALLSTMQKKELAVVQSKQQRFTSEEEAPPQLMLFQ
jgi:DNA mismatch repair ATPase MutS